jgi:hypothetical protein
MCLFTCRSQAHIAYLEAAVISLHAQLERANQALNERDKEEERLRADNEYLNSRLMAMVGAAFCEFIINFIKILFVLPRRPSWWNCTSFLLPLLLPLRSSPVRGRSHSSTTSSTPHTARFDTWQVQSPHYSSSSSHFNNNTHNHIWIRVMCDSSSMAVEVGSGHQGNVERVVSHSTNRNLSSSNNSSSDLVKVR